MRDIPGPITDSDERGVDEEVAVETNGFDDEVSSDDVMAEATGADAGTESDES